MNPADLVKSWFGGSPGSPMFAQPFIDQNLVHDFGPDQDTSVGISNSIAITGASSNAEILTPTNGTLRYVPKLTEMTKEKKAAFLKRWPDLYLIGGNPYNAEEGDILFEIWPTAFRRLEVMFSTVEGIAEKGKKVVPQIPVPRWFIFHGIEKNKLEKSINNIMMNANPDPFFAGELSIYVHYNTHLAKNYGVTVYVSAFDSSGLVIDPAIFCAYLAELADNPLFTPFAAQNADIFNLVKPRHVIIFSDHRGKLRLVNEENPPVPPLPPQEPRKYVLTCSGNVMEGDLDDSSCLMFRENEPNYTSLKNKLVGITITGKHRRIALHPHGKSDETTKASFGAWTFLRVRVTDLAMWFPKNENQKNSFERYTEKNELIPLIDGQETFREIYRAYRSTYCKEIYNSDDHMPSGTPLSLSDCKNAKIFMTNFKISPDTMLLGRRALLTVPRTQPDAKIENPLKTTVLIPAASTKDESPQKSWWLVCPKGTLPPGSYIELEPLGIGSKFFDDDSRIPGKDRGADMYGITVPCLDLVGVFANADGEFFLPVKFDSDWSKREAELRVITWKPGKDDMAPFALETTGKGTKKVHAFGIVTVPEPTNMSVPKISAPWTDDPQFILSSNGVADGAILTVKGGSLSGSGTLFVINQRSGYMIQSPFSAGASDLNVAIQDFASNDVALIGARLDNWTDPGLCSGFFSVSVSPETRATGCIPSHPKELIGVIREAIEAGVDVRLLTYPDQLSTPIDMMGMVLAINASIDGKCGQAIADPVLRETNSHHQKTGFILSNSGVTALLGGIDQNPSRWNSNKHETIDPDRPNWGLWHDIHCLIRGKAAWDVFRNFRQRWNIASVDSRVIGAGVEYTAVDDLIMMDYVTSTNGTNAVQINRTLPPYIIELVDIVDPDKGEQSILRSYERAFENSRHFIYIEDQYFFNIELAKKLNERLLAPDGPKSLILVLPKELSEFPVLDLTLYAIRARAVKKLLYGDGAAGGFSDVSDRVVIVHLKNDQDKPVYVHAKTVIIDDLWMSIGSSNINRRSMTYDTELNAASIDARILRGMHVTAHETRVRLMAEHLGLDKLEYPLVEDFHSAFELFRGAISDQPSTWLKDRHQLIKYDAQYTLYGLQPPDYNEVFSDALNILIDPDGQKLDLSVNLLGFVELLNALKSAEEGTFGGIGTFKVTFDFTPLTIGILDHVVAQVKQLPSGPIVDIGPLGVNTTASLGIQKIGNTYSISADVFDATDTKLGSANIEAKATGFVTDVTLVFY
ncbi:MAG: phospholipase D-like domain-containing protein [Methanothrix sp.]